MGKGMVLEAGMIPIAPWQHSLNGYNDKDLWEETYQQRASEQKRRVNEVNIRAAERKDML